MWNIDLVKKLVMHKELIYHIEDFLIQITAPEVGLDIHL